MTQEVNQTEIILICIAILLIFVGGPLCWICNCFSCIARCCNCLCSCLCGCCRKKKYESFYDYHP
jgi:hypothetical protein